MQFEWGKCVLSFASVWFVVSCYSKWQNSSAVMFSNSRAELICQITHSSAPEMSSEGRSWIVTWWRAVCSVISLLSLIQTSPAFIQLVLLTSLIILLESSQHTTTEPAAKISASSRKEAALCFFLNRCTWLFKLDVLKVNFSAARSSSHPCSPNTTCNQELRKDPL